MTFLIFPTTSFYKEENKRLDLPTPFTTDHDLEILDLCKHGDIVGKAFFCFKKPPKAEDNDNENTHFQRGHIKNIKLSFFSNNVDTQTRNCCFMHSTDDKAYLRPGTSEGFEKSRNVRILTLTLF